MNIHTSLMLGIVNAMLEQDTRHHHHARNIIIAEVVHDLIMEYSYYEEEIVSRPD